MSRPSTALASTVVLCGLLAPATTASPSAAADSSVVAAVPQPADLVAHDLTWDPAWLPLGGPVLGEDGTAVALVLPGEPGGHKAVVWDPHGRPVRVELGGSHGDLSWSDAGYLVGTADDLGPASHRPAFVWTRTSGAHLITPNDWTVRLGGINRSGQVALSGGPGPGEQRLQRWTPGVGLEDLGEPNGTQAEAIDDRGRVLASGPRGLVLVDGRRRTRIGLPHLPGGTWQVVSATFNDRGHVAGTVRPSLPADPAAASSWFLWTPGQGFSSDSFTSTVWGNALALDGLGASRTPRPPSTLPARAGW
jgi:hypothetical protein